MDLSFLPTAYVVRREGNVFTRVCPSIHQSVCPHLGRGGTPAQGGTPPRVSPVRPGWGWGVPPQSDLAGGTPAGGYPTSGPPLSDLPGGGVPHVGKRST